MGSVRAFLKSQSLDEEIVSYVCAAIEECDAADLRDTIGSFLEEDALEACMTLVSSNQLAAPSSPQVSQSKTLNVPITCAAFGQDSKPDKAQDDDHADGATKVQ